MKNNIEIITINNEFGSTEHIIIRNEDGGFTTMLKSTYDEMIANQQNGTIS